MIAFCGPRVFSECLCFDSRQRSTISVAVTVVSRRSKVRTNYKSDATLTTKKLEVQIPNSVNRIVQVPTVNGKRKLTTLSDTVASGISTTKSLQTRWYHCSLQWYHLVSPGAFFKMNNGEDKRAGLLSPRSVGLGPVQSPALPWFQNTGNLLPHTESAILTDMIARRRRLSPPFSDH